MKVGTGGNLGLSREYHKKLFGLAVYMVELSFKCAMSQVVMVSQSKYRDPFTPWSCSFIQMMFMFHTCGGMIQCPFRKQHYKNSGCYIDSC